MSSLTFWRNPSWLRIHGAMTAFSVCFHSVCKFMVKQAGFYCKLCFILVSPVNSESCSFKILVAFVFY